jgi:hypothetical protein
MLGKLVALLVVASVATEIQAQSVILPLCGNFHEIYMYYVHINVGTPGNDFTVTVDTGSSDLLVPDVGCKPCFGGNRQYYYNGTSSSTSHAIPCDNPAPYNCQFCTLDRKCSFTIPYAGIEEVANMYQDTVNVMSSSVSAVFGSITDIKQNMRKRHANSVMQFNPAHYPEGMWGMAYSSLNAAGAAPLFDVLVEDGLPDQFSLCMNTVTGGGFLTLGTTVTTGANVVYTPIIKERFYNVYLEDMQVNGYSLGLDPSVYNTMNTIVDSGTPTMTVPTAVWQAMLGLFNKMCAESPLPGVCIDVQAPNATLFDGVCYEMTEDQIAQFPTLSFTLTNNAVLTYEPQAYLQTLWYCDSSAARSGGKMVGFGLQEDPSGFGTVFGATFMQQYTTIFDRQNARIGFTRDLPCKSTLCY